MTRINTNVQSLIAQRVLGQNNNGLSQSLERLSTGVRINRGKDDPAGLIASENLRSELAGTRAAVTTAERADQVVNIAEGGLQEVSGLLTALQGLLTASSSEAGLSSAEKDANQDQIDSILQTVDRIASATSFQGTKLLNGNFAFETSNVDSNVEDFKVNGAKFESDNLDVDVVVYQSAQQAGVYLSLGGANIDLGNQSTFTIEISGSLGSREVSFASGTSVATIVSTVNNFTDVTGITASAGTTGLALRSEESGSDEFVSVKTIDAGDIQGSGGIFGFNATNTGTILTSGATTFADATNGVRDEGQDIGASINGVVATSDGRTISVNTDFLDAEITLDTTASTTLAAVSAFQIDGGGANFQLSGNVDVIGRVSLGISNVAARELGKVVDDGTNYFLSDLAGGKSLDVTKASSQDFSRAQEVVANAINEISSTRGRLGAFQKNTIGATVRSLGVAIENTAAAESVIRDADFASETAALTRNQILVSAATNTLSLANSSPQSALQLLG